MGGGAVDWGLFDLKRLRAKGHAVKCTCDECKAAHDRSKAIREECAVKGAAYRKSKGLE